MPYFPPVSLETLLVRRRKGNAIDLDSPRDGKKNRSVPRRDVYGFGLRSCEKISHGRREKSSLRRNGAAKFPRGGFTSVTREIGELHTRLTSAGRSSTVFAPFGRIAGSDRTSAAAAINLVDRMRPPRV